MANNMNSSPGRPVCSGIYLKNKLPVFILSGLNSQAQRILGITFIKEKRVWLTPAYLPFTDAVVEDIKTVYPDIHLDDAAKKLISAAERTRKALDTLSLVSDDFDFTTQPLDHQISGLNYALAYPRTGLFFDCGLGKTKVIIDYLTMTQEKALVLVPTMGMSTWEYEAELHSGDKLTTRIISGTRKKRTQIIEECCENTPDIMIASYGIIERDREKLLQLPYEVIVADESHSLKTYNSQRTKAAIALSKIAYRRILLTGTPSLGSPQHLWGQLTFLAPFIGFQNYWRFRHMFITVSPYNKHIVTGYKNMEILRDRVQSVCLRKERQYCTDLPERTFIDVPFTPTARQRRDYNQLVNTQQLRLTRFKQRLSDTNNNISTDAEKTKLVDYFEAANAGVLIQKLLQILSGFFIVPPPEICDECAHVIGCVAAEIKPYTHMCKKAQTPPSTEYIEYAPNPKLDVLQDLLDSILASEHNKVIIWAHFSKELDIIENYLKTINVSYVRVDGSNSGNAQMYSKKFQTDAGPRVWVGQIATGVAITLTRAAYTIYYGLNYKLDDFIQSQDRNYRIGSSEKVFVYLLTAKNTVLEYVKTALQQKKDIAATLTDRINCVFCPHSIECLGKGIKPFDEQCVYKDSISRSVTKLMSL